MNFFIDLLDLEGRHSLATLNIEDVFKFSEEHVRLNDVEEGDLFGTGRYIGLLWFGWLQNRGLRLLDHHARTSAHCSLMRTIKALFYSNHRCINLEILIAIDGSAYILSFAVDIDLQLLAVDEIALGDVELIPHLLYLGEF